MSTHDHRRRFDRSAGQDTGAAATPGKVTLTSRVQRREASAPPPSPSRAAPTADRHALQDQGLARAMGFVDEPPRVVQRATVQLSEDAHSGLDDAHVQAVAAHGTAGPGGALPHLDAIQRSFGPHDVTGVKAHVGGAATDASAALGAHAYATGDHVAFAEAPSLALAAHEAAHVVQQRAGVHLSSAVGQAGDAYEQHADAVAARVVAGESAADLLGATSGVGGQRAAIQRDAAPAAAKTPMVSEVPVEQSESLLNNLEHAARAFQAASHLGQIAYKFALAQADAKLVHEHVEEDYKKATEAREKKLAKSTFMKVFEAVTAILSIAGGLSKIVGAAKDLYEQQKVFREARGTIKRWDGVPTGELLVEEAKHKRTESAKKGVTAVFDAGKGGGDVGKGAKQLGAENPDTMLSDENHRAILALDEAADRLSETEGEFHLATIWERGKDGELELIEWKRGVTRMAANHQRLPASRDGEFKKAFEDVSAGQRDFEASMFKLQKVWAIYHDHGSEAVASTYERPVLEKLIAWAHAKDPRLAKIQISMDQNARHMRFHGTRTTEERDHAVGGYIVSTHAHAYANEFVQIESGNIYVSDPEIARELGLWVKPIKTRWGEGEAEKQEDQRFKGATKYWASLAMCKALETVGVLGLKMPATIILTAPSGGTMRIEERHQGHDYQNWKDTATFTKFWETHLGAQFGYILEDKKGTPESFAGATDKAKRRSISLEPNERGGREGHL